MDVTIGATLTGGSTVALTPAGISPGRSVFTTPDHTRLTPETVEFGATGGNVSAQDPGTARTSMKISFASRVTEEG